MHELLNNPEYSPPDLGKTFKESTPTKTVTNLSRLMGGSWRARHVGVDSPEPPEEFDEDGYFISESYNDAWYDDNQCD